MGLIDLQSVPERRQLADNFHKVGAEVVIAFSSSPTTQMC
jgi:hypothetical protein